MGPSDPRDVALIEALARALGDDLVPDRVVAAAKASLTWRTIDAELAELAFDSLDEAALAGVRGATTAQRSLSFTTSDVAIDAEVADLPGGRRHLTGIAVVGDAEEVRLGLEQPGGTVAIERDDLGRFSIDASSGPARFVIERLGNPRVVTGWVNL
jgi:hypothetical protein